MQGNASVFYIEVYIDTGSLQYPIFAQSPLYLYKRKLFILFQIYTHGKYS